MEEEKKELIENEETLEPEEQIEEDGIETAEGGIETAEGEYEDVESLYGNPEESPEPKKFGQEEYEKTLDNKNYYKDKENDIKEKQEKNQKEQTDTKKELEEAKKAREEAKNARNETKGNAGSTKEEIKQKKEEYKETNKKYKKAKKKEKEIKQEGKALNQSRRQNKLSNIKSNMYKATHRMETAKLSAKNFAKKKVEKAKAELKKQAINFLKKNPYVLIGLIAFAAILLLLIIMMAALSGGAGGAYGATMNDGYYENDYNFNETTITYSNCNEDNAVTINIEDFVKGSLYSYTKNIELSDESLKAIMIIIKTNALSLGGYTSNNKNINISGCNLQYEDINNIEESLLKKYNNLYNSIKDLLYISESYDSEITSLSTIDSLSFDYNKVNDINNISDGKNYEEILSTVYPNEGNTSIASNIGNFFIGDSRTLYFKSYGITSDSNSVYAGAMGYHWFAGNTATNRNGSYNCKINAIECANSKIGSNQKNIIVWLGVNDVTNYELYYNKFIELANGEWKNHYIYIASVGYVDGSKNLYVNNSQIDTFNNFMRQKVNESNISNLKYIDLGFTKDEMGKGTSDGVHYTKSFSKKIYDKMVSFTNREISGNRKIYNLSDHITYYTLTNNTAWWWPIGSTNETSPGIYGGNPYTTHITSNYGYRIHPTTHERSFHTGIDIGWSGIDGQPVIAARDGKVTLHVTDSPTAGNYVVVDHGDGYATRYLHMKENSVVVKVGDQVRQGQKIGSVGMTGRGTGSHLHFDILVNNNYVNPLDYVSVDAPRQVNKYGTIIANEGAKNPSEVKKEMCRSLLASGFSENAVAGILANIAGESSMDLDNLEGCYEQDVCCKNIPGYPNGYGYCITGNIIGQYGSDERYTNAIDSGAYSRENFVSDKAGYGLIQWTASSRKAGLYDYAKAQNKSIASISVQLGYLLKELESYPVTYKYITGNYSAYDIANNFCLDFERPADKENTCRKRANNYASSMLTYVQNSCS